MLTLLQRAEKLGLPEHDISILETGRSTLEMTLKERIAEALQKPAFELFDC